MICIEAAPLISIACHHHACLGLALGLLTPLLLSIAKTHLQKPHENEQLSKLVITDYNIQTRRDPSTHRYGLLITRACVTNPNFPSHLQSTIFLAQHKLMCNPVSSCGYTSSRSIQYWIINTRILSVCKICKTVVLDAAAKSSNYDSASTRTASLLQIWEPNC